MTTHLTLDQILAAADVGEEVVDVPEWGGTVKIRGLTKAKQIELRKAATVMVPGPNGQATPEVDTYKLELLMVAACAVEPAITFEQAAALAEKLAGPVDRLIVAITRLSGLGDKAAKEAEKST